MSLDDAQQIVASFQKAMGEANAAIRENPRKNDYAIWNKTAIEEAIKPAPYLEYSSGNATLSENLKLRRSLWSRQLSSNDTASPPRTSNSSSLSYTIPPEVVEAARVLAEANPPDTSSDAYDAIVKRIRAKYMSNKNDTNVMKQVLQSPSGLEEIQITVANASESDPYLVTSGPLGSQKRAATKFWMETTAQSGSSPFAPAGYKVWRNVKDYGAKGDGVTDDTAAIQKAMTDGGRCGANCGASTIHPATLYFPSGSYLISSSIIMYYNTEMLGNVSG